VSCLTETQTKKVKPPVCKIDKNLQKEPTYYKGPYNNASKEFVARNHNDKALNND
jgi:hypothetical protein